MKMETHQLFGHKSRSISKSAKRMTNDNLKSTNYIQMPKLHIAYKENIENSQFVPRELLPIKHYAPIPEFVSASAYMRLKKHLEIQRKLISKLNKDVGVLKNKIHSDNDTSNRRVIHKKIRNNLKLPGFRNKNDTLATFNCEISSHSCTNVKKLNITTTSKGIPSKINIEFQSPSLIHLKRNRISEAIKKALSKKRDNLVASFIYQRESYTPINNVSEDNITQDNQMNTSHDSSLDNTADKIGNPKRKIIYIRTKPPEGNQTISIDNKLL